jgi:hypothetical protein
MATETDLRLRSWLDANQRDREQMCRSILALDPHYANVRPRHPAGGPDGGRDIEAIYETDRVTCGAVGFQNGANDSNEQKKAIKAKFTSDLAAALDAKPGLKAFVFFTNLHFTMSEQTELKEIAKSRGVEHCDVLDRERLRIELDAPSSFFIRFQYLSIPLSEAEQASFLSRYGDRIQELVSAGFDRIETILNRLLFFEEAATALDILHVRLQLNRGYSASEIGHFRAFVRIGLREPKIGIRSIIFGTSDKAIRFGVSEHGASWEEERFPKHASMGQWEEPIKSRQLFRCVGVGSQALNESISFIPVLYRHDMRAVRGQPTLQLRDLDDCRIVIFVSQSLAHKLDSIEIMANGYMLTQCGRSGFEVSPSRGDFGMADRAFTPEELADQWAKVTAANATQFTLRFSSATPRRLSRAEELREPMVGKVFSFKTPPIKRSPPE